VVNKDLTIRELKNIGQEQHGSEGNPGFNDVAQYDFTLDGSFIDSGADLSGEVGRVTVMGNQIVMHWEDVLNPTTIFNVFPPDVRMADQNVHGSGWEIGAYVFSEGPQDCSDLGGSCCSAGQTCDEGSFVGSDDCGNLCCVDGLCHTPVPTCQNQDHSCCDECQSGPHTGYDSDCPGQVCCEECVPAPLDCTGLVMLMHMDNDPTYGESTTHVYDFSGNGNSGTVSGAAHTSSGKFGGAFDFDGVDDYIVIPDDSSLEHSAISSCLWMNIQGDGSAANGNYILSKGRQDSQPHISYLIAYDPNVDTIYCAFGLDGTIRSIDSKTLFTPPSGWIHVCCTYDGSDILLYIGGVEDVGGSYSGTIDYGLEVDDLHIGDCGQAGEERRFDGFIDEVSVWNRALSSDEISSLYDSDMALSCGCVHITDLDCDGCIDTGELFAFIDFWRQNQATIGDLMEAIGIWKSGCP